MYMHVCKLDSKKDDKPNILSFYKTKIKLTIFYKKKNLFWEGNKVLRVKIEPNEKKKPPGWNKKENIGSFYFLQHADVWVRREGER